MACKTLSEKKKKDIGLHIFLSSSVWFLRTTIEELHCGSGGFLQKNVINTIVFIFLCEAITADLWAHFQID